MNLEAQWITGFVDGEGCFHVGINKNSEMSTGFQVLLEFTVVQHKRDIQILHALKSHFRCGVVRAIHDDLMAYRVRSIDHLMKYIIPFFEVHKLKTKKRLDFQKFRKIFLIMQKGLHLTKDGIEEIRIIKEQMNIGKLR